MSNKFKIPSKEELIKLVQSGALTEKEKIELLQLFEAKRKEQALKDYAIFAEEYIKITDKKGNQVPFIHNPIQKKINEKIKELLQSLITNVQHQT